MMTLIIATIECSQRTYSLTVFIFIAEPCKYTKGTWSECDPKTNMRSRTLTLKKGDQGTCEANKTIQKKCKKGNYLQIRPISRFTYAFDTMFRTCSEFCQLRWSAKQIPELSKKSLNVVSVKALLVICTFISYLTLLFYLQNIHA